MFFILGLIKFYVEPYFSLLEARVEYDSGIL